MMNQSNADIIAYALTEETGIDFSGRIGQDESGAYIDIIPNGIDIAEGFIIHVKVGWRSIEAEFRPGNFSASLIQSMGKAPIEKKEVFKLFAEGAIKSGGQLNMKINGIPADLVDITNWQSDWRTIQLSLKYMPIFWEESDVHKLESKIVLCAGKLIMMLCPLLPLDESDNEIEKSTEGLPEGAVTRVEANRYERNHLNRAVCIEKNGIKCAVCGFDFGKVFGCIGEGYVHVHHIIPVSQIGSNYRINPLKDLVPVCPNCHAMLHRKNPPYTIDELKNIISTGII